jgi:hypothetical protein
LDFFGFRLDWVRNPKPIKHCVQFLIGEGSYDSKIILVGIKNPSMKKIKIGFDLKSAMKQVFFCV